MKARLLSSLAMAALTGSALAQAPDYGDIWDVSQGATVTASSPILGGGYTAGAMFGEFGPWSGGLSWTYFEDFQAPGTTHFVEWEIPADTTIGQIRIFAFGDGSSLNDGREFNSVTIRAKSAGSSVYDLTLLTFAPTHPYTFIDYGSSLLVDQVITPTPSRSFRAEFVQREAGNGWDGPRIVEMDALPVAPPQILAHPQNVVVNFGMPAVFSVEATGVGTLQYQWLKDGVPLVGKTAASLRIDPVAATDVGAYSVSVTDANSSIVAGPATLILDHLNLVESNADLWDIRSGAVITANSGVLSVAGTIEGMFGGLSGAWESHLTYFSDNQPTGTVHFVEWTTPSPVTVRALRLFAYGDGSGLNDGREFQKLTVRTKSVGSSTFDTVIATYTPTHPYTFIDNILILDLECTPVQGSEFRAEFLQYTAGYGFDGPRIVEFDAFSTRPLVRPTVLTNPNSQTLPKNSTVQFKVTARGGSLSYQWKFMGQNINGQTTDTLNLKHVKAKDHGYYTCVVSNPAGTVESAPALLLVTGN